MRLVKNGRKIVGFIGQDKEGYWFAFGKPSQASYVTFGAKTLNEAVAKIQVHSGLYDKAKLSA